MKIRQLPLRLDEITLAEARGVVLHPDLRTRFLEELTTLEHKEKLCRLPSTVLEYYHNRIHGRVNEFQRCCEEHNIVLSS